MNRTLAIEATGPREEMASRLGALAYERGESLEAVISQALEAYVGRPSSPAWPAASGSAVAGRG